MSTELTGHVVWTGAAAGAVENYDTYSRDFESYFEKKPTLRLSTGLAYHGDAQRYDPEDLLLTSLALCYAQTFLAICAKSGVRVMSYEDRPTIRLEEVDRIPRFTHATLRPRVRVAEGVDPERVRRLHDSAARHCFVARSVSFPIACEPETIG